MQKIYLDQAATSFPKAPGTADAVFRFMTECGCNVGRGSYAGAYSAEEIVYDTRMFLCRLFGCGNDPAGPKRVVFTKNVTESLNILLKGFLRHGDHVLVSSMEHNAVMRPLRQLEKQGVRFDRVPCAADGSMSLKDLEERILPSTKAVVMLHASNVCGTVLPVAQIGAVCRARGIRFILDAAQTAGVLPLDMEGMCIDALAFTGHKGLLGPQGTGGFLIRGEMAEELEYELAHPLQYRGEFDAEGVPRMSDLEAVEFVCVEETRRAVLPMIYAVRNGSATYAGAQLFGLVHAYYDYLAEKTGAGDPDLILDPSSLSLPDVIDIPYYDYVSETSPGTPPAMLSLERFNRELKGVTKLFIALLEMEKR